MSELKMSLAINKAAAWLWGLTSSILTSGFSVVGLASLLVSVSSSKVMLSKSKPPGSAIVCGRWWLSLVFLKKVKKRLEVGRKFKRRRGTCFTLVSIRKDHKQVK